MSVDVRAKLAEKGLTLPIAAKPVAAYVPAVRTGKIVFTAGQLPLVDGAMVDTGKVGAEPFMTTAPGSGGVLAQRAVVPDDDGLLERAASANEHSGNTY